MERFHKKKEKKKERVIAIQMGIDHKAFTLPFNINNSVQNIHEVRSSRSSVHTVVICIHTHKQTLQFPGSPTLKSGQTSTNLFVQNVDKLTNSSVYCVST